MKTVVISREELIDLLDERIEKALSRFKEEKNDSKDKDETLLTRHDLARLFGVSLVTINEWCRKEILRPHHMNSRVYFYKSEVMETLSAKQHGKRRGR